MCKVRPLQCDLKAQKQQQKKGVVGVYQCFKTGFTTAGYDNGGSGGRMRSPGRGYYGGGGGGRSGPPGGGGRPYKVLCVSELHPKASDDVVRDTLYRQVFTKGSFLVIVGFIRLEWNHLDTSSLQNCPKKKSKRVIP